MRTRSAAALTAAGIVGGGIVGGFTYAAVSTPAAASSGTPAPAASTAAPAGVHNTDARRAGRRLLARVEHGEVTLQTRRGDRTVELQRGVVTAVSATAISVRSHDGFTDHYTVTPQSRVRAKSGLTTIGHVHKGDKVFVVATGGNVLRVRDASA